MLPMKFTRTWKWENTWLVFSLVSLIFLPWALALGLVSHLFDVYLGLSLVQLAVPFLFGAGWGIAQVLFGISVQRLGLGLAYAIIVGLGAALGTLVPLFTQHRSQVGRVALLEVLAGVAIMVIGVSLSTWGGQIRERHHRPALQSGPASGYSAAVLLAILCGVMAPMLNYSFAFGQEIAQQASHFGNTALRSAYAVWPIGLAGGLLPNIAYSLYLLRKNKSWKSFQVPAPDVFWSILMGVLWMGGIRTLWHECDLPGISWDLDRLGTVPDLHDHDRDALRSIDGRVEGCSALGHVAVGVGPWIPNLRHSAALDGEPMIRAPVLD